MRYEKTQYGWIVYIIFSAVIGFMLLAYLKQWGTNPIPKVPFLIMTGVFLIPIVLFYKLTIIVNERSIRIIFGIGIVKRTIRPDRILSAEVFKAPWYYGIGIRMTPYGWLYSINGFKSVKIKFEKDGLDKTILIGTSEPEELKRAIDNHFS